MQSYFQDGYKLKINKFEQCDNNVIYKLTNPVLELTKDCNAFFKGCVEVTKAIKTFKVHLKLGSVHYVNSQYKK
jgi:hypothetical protein